MSFNELSAEKIYHEFAWDGAHIHQDDPEDCLEEEDSDDPSDV